MTLFLSDNQSILKALQSFEQLYRYARLKLNKAKTETTIAQNDDVG